MRYLVFFVILVLSAAGNCTSLEVPLGDKLRDAHLSPFAPGELSGGKGPIPNQAAVQVINEKLRPFRNQDGLLGFLSIGSIFAVDEVVVSESFGERTQIKTAFSFSGKQSRAEVLRDLTALILAEKSQAGLKSVTSCVRGSYWYEREAWGYEACYEQDADGNWVMTSYRTWRAREQEP